MEPKGGYPFTVIEMLSASGLRIVQAVQKIHEGLAELSAGLGTETPETLKRDLSVLTKRQREIFELMGQKATVDTIAKRLRLTARTVEAHRNTIRLRLKFSNAGELRAFAIDHAKEIP